MKGSAVAVRDAAARERVAPVGRLRGAGRHLAAAVVLVSAGCAARVPVATTPAYPAFVFPSVPTAYIDAPTAQDHEQAWAFLQSGDLATAESQFAILFEADGRFYPAAAGLGWVKVAAGRSEEAVGHFEAALAVDAAYVPALVGRGEALLRTDDRAGALRSFEVALGVDPSLRRIDRLVGELRLQVMTERLSGARAALDAGRLAEAETAYRQVIAASPDSAFLYVELARLKQRQGDVAEALAAARRAQRLDQTDGAAFLLEGELLEASGDLGSAAEAYRRAETIDPSDTSATALTRVRDALRTASLPPAYREIDRRAEVTRGDLAALLGVELGDLLRDAGLGATTPIFTDTRTHWATPWIVEVTRAGVMRVEGRSQFEPDRVVRRGELAEVVAETLLLIAELDPGAGRRWQEARPRLGDMPPGHLNYDSASMAVAAGVIVRLEDDRFEPTRPVTGREAIDVVDRLTRLSEEAG